VSLQNPPNSEGFPEGAGDKRQQGSQILPTEAVGTGHGSKPKKEKRWFRPNNLIKYATVTFVGAYTIITLCLFLSTRDSNRSQLEKITEGNRIAREAFVSTQRAFITVSQVKIEMRDGLVPGETGKPGTKVQYWWFTPEIENSGNTPTKNLRYRPIASCGPRALALGPKQAFYCPTDISGPEDPDDPSHDTLVPAKSVLGPHAKIPIGGVGVLPGFLQEISNTGFKWYIYGSIHYNDIFVNSESHVTKYCFGISLTDLTEMKPGYGLCEHWNCADDECKVDRDAYDVGMAKTARKQIPLPPK
jgi:hypothetical protein